MRPAASLTLLLGTALAPPALAQAVAIDDAPRVAVMSAYEPEWQALQAEMTEVAEHDVNGSTFLTGTLRGKPVVLLLSGVSMVNAAMTTQQVLDRFDVDAIVFSGIAGGVDPALDIGDVVVPERWAQYLDMVIARETREGEFSPPPFLDTPHANFGMIHPRVIDTTAKGEDGPQKRFWFEVDAALLDTARAVVEDVTLEPCAAEGECLSEPPQVVVGGSGVSGSAFVDNAAFRQYVHDTFEARVLDMESAAVAHVAYNNAVPFIAFRSLSDLAGGGEAENEIGTFFGLASGNAASVVAAFVEAMEMPAAE